MYVFFHNIKALFVFLSGAKVALFLDNSNFLSPVFKFICKICAHTIWLAVYTFSVKRSARFYGENNFIV